MKRTEIIKITKPGKRYQIAGFVHTIRDHGKIAFVLVRDRTGIVQCVIEGRKQLQTVKKLTRESVVTVVGTTQKPYKPLSSKVIPLELVAQKIRIESKAARLPFDPFEAEKVAPAKRFKYRWLDLRRPKGLLIFKVWTALERGFREALLRRGFIQIYTPSIMSHPSESGAEVFELQYFEKKAYLAQSPQFYKQMAMAAGFEKVFMTGPVFRAEPSFTTRHLTEFTGWDLEVSYISSHHELIDLEEKILIAMFKKVKQETSIEVQIPKRPFPRIPLLEAKKLLAKHKVPSEKADDLSPLEERKLAEIIKKQTGSDFVFVTDYPVSARPFYHMRHKTHPELTKSYDLLYKGLEITTGAQREHRYEVLKKQAIEKGLSLTGLKHYLEFFRYGCPPHGGMGLGPGRIVMKMLELSSVREATFLPRSVKRLTP